VKVDYRTNPAYVFANLAMQLGADPSEIAGPVAQLAAYCDEPVPTESLRAWMPCNPDIGQPVIIDFILWANDTVDVCEAARWADDGGRHVEA
jgi:hypothetical protein